MPEGQPDGDDPPPARDHYAPEGSARPPGSRPVVALLTGPLGIIAGIVIVCGLCNAFPAIAWDGISFAAILWSWVPKL
jgi:hypothetical protein